MEPCGLAENQRLQPSMTFTSRSGVCVFVEWLMRHFITQKNTVKGLIKASLVLTC